MSERNKSNNWDTTYEWKAVTLLGLGFGLVGLDRWIIAPLFPFVLDDLGLNLQDQGNIIGALGLAWGVFAVFSGRLSDAIGHRKVLIPAVFLFNEPEAFGLIEPFHFASACHDLYLLAYERLQQKSREVKSLRGVSDCMQLPNF